MTSVRTWEPVAMLTAKRSADALAGLTVDMVKLGPETANDQPNDRELDLEQQGMEQ